MSRLLHPLEKFASLLTKYIGLIIICFSVLAFFWRDGFAWTTNYLYFWVLPCSAWG